MLLSLLTTHKEPKKRLGQNSQINGGSDQKVAASIILIKKEIRIPQNVLKCNHDKTSTKKGRFLCTKIIP